METARVLHSAHEVSAEIVAKAETEANRLLTEGREEIDQIRSQTESRLAGQTAAAESAVADLRDRTNEQVAAGLEAARTEADELLSEAREHCRAMVDEAQGLRARVLADLSKRRKVLHAQIEQLRAGRERLTETVQDVRRSIDSIAEDLFAAEDNARLAAEAAGRHMAERPDVATPEEMAALLLAEEAEAGVSEPPPGEAGPQGVVTVVETVTAEVLVSDEPASEGGDDRVEEASEGADESPVDALFAKIRASTHEAEVGGDAMAEASATHPEESPTGDSDNATPDTSGRAGGDQDPPDDQPEGPPEERSPFAIRRDELTDPIVTTLARRLKRTLQDSQNELLDSLRSSGSRWSTDLLPDETEHVDSYATAAMPALEQAAAAGVSFAGAGAARGPRTDVLVGIADDLAREVVGPLRRRLSDDGPGLDGADEAVVAEHVGSAFREWKGERIERLAGDHVVAAFSAGTISTVTGEPGARLEWVPIAGSGRSVPGLRGQRPLRPAGERRGIPHWASVPSGPPGVSMPAHSLCNLGCSRAFSQ